MTNTRSQNQRSVRMSPFECWQMLDGREQIARIVWSTENGPAIVPVNYTIADGALWFQVNSASALGRTGNGQRVLVEVDQADQESQNCWSVIVAGVAEFMDTSGTPDILRALQVWPSGPHNMSVRVHPDEISGRRLVLMQ